MLVFASQQFCFKFGFFSFHSDQLVEDEDDDEDVDEEIEEEEWSVDGDEDSRLGDVDDDGGDISMRRHSSASTFGQRSFFSFKRKGLHHDHLMIKEEMKFRNENYNQNSFERYSCNH